MRIASILRAVPALGLASLVALAALPGPAQAQGFSLFPWEWDWGGGQEVGGAGKTSVSFPSGFKPGQIIVSFTDRRLYYVYQRGAALSYPIASPRRQSAWQGVMRVSRKRINPPWTPTPSMRRENPSLPAHVPGGHPQNPLGSHALYLGSSLYRIHGTDAPWTIGQPVSKGCIRMYNRDVRDLYRRVGVGTRVVVTYRSFYG